MDDKVEKKRETLREFPFSLLETMNDKVELPSNYYLSRSPSM